MTYFCDDCDAALEAPTDSDTIRCPGCGELAGKATIPTDELRAAAERLREKAASAHRASPSPWAVTAEHVVRCADGMVVADRSGTDHPAERADLPYIALMGPGVGLALADWLDVAAEDPEQQHYPNCTPQTCIALAALAVARQILGTEVKTR